MATLSFETLTFREDKDSVIVRFLRNYRCTIPKKTLEKLGKFHASKNTISFPDVSEKRLQHKFPHILAAAFEDLTNVMTGKKTFYIHENSGIPLIGSRYIGIMDRGSNMLEIKPLTGCNMGCSFCSVDEGIGSKKQHDLVVERSYLVSETKKLLDFKQHKGMHVYINVHGEPLLYADIVGLIEDLAAISWVSDITIITTAVLLTQDLVDSLAAAGLTEFNVSISAVDPTQAKALMGTQAYDIEKVKKIVTYARSKVKTTIAPVWLDGINDAEIEPLIAFAKSIDCPIRIQKFCHNRFGRNPVDEISWEAFFEKIAALENKTGVTLKDADFSVAETKELPKPFKKGDVVSAKIITTGRYVHEKLCMAENRLISVPRCRKDKGTISVKILRSTHNVFVGEAR